MKSFKYLKINSPLPVKDILNKANNNIMKNNCANLLANHTNSKNKCDNTQYIDNDKPFEQKCKYTDTNINNGENNNSCDSEGNDVYNYIKINSNINADNDVEILYGQLGCSCSDVNYGLKDNFTKPMLIELIEHFNDHYQFILNFNKSLKNKKMRLTNYPSEITENIVKFAIIKKYKITPTWDTKSGDLMLYNKHLEVKGSANLENGPPTFGPNEKWFRIYFVDAIDMLNKNFKVYEIKLTHDSDIWKNMKINTSSNYKQICNTGKRPRIKFKNIIEQIPTEYISIIFNGNINDI